MKNQKGFSAVEGLIIIVIVAAIGFAGWSAFNRNNDQDDALIPPETSANEAGAIAMLDLQASGEKTPYQQCVDGGNEVSIVNSVSECRAQDTVYREDGIRDGDDDGVTLAPLEYIRDKYGLTFQYPDDWDVELAADAGTGEPIKKIILRPQPYPDVRVELTGYNPGVGFIERLETIGSGVEFVRIVGQGTPGQDVDSCHTKFYSRKQNVDDYTRIKTVQPIGFENHKDVHCELDQLVRDMISTFKES